MIKNTKSLEPLQYERLFSSWYKPFKEECHKYITRDFLTKKIASKNLRPKAKNVFKAFQLCNFEDVKLVIIGQDPYTEGGKATGLLFGNPVDTHYISPSLKMMWEKAEEASNGLILDFDVTLESWAKQGVLLINASLTVDGNNRGGHFYHWFPFISSLLEKLSNIKSNVVYILLGSYAKEYEKFINYERNLILKYYHPAYAIRKKTKWEMDGLILANKYLNKHKNCKIKW